MTPAENQTYIWTCPDCEYENSDPRRTEVSCKGCGLEFDYAPGTGSTAIESPIRIDLNGPFTKEDVRKLIASVDDERAWSLVITYAGQALFLEFHANRERLGLGGEPTEVDLSEMRPEQLMQEWKGDRARDERLLEEKSDEVFLRFETYGIGTGDVGPDAAQDDRHVGEIFQRLKRLWEQKPIGVGYVGDL